MASVDRAWRLIVIDVAGLLDTTNAWIEMECRTAERVPQPLRHRRRTLHIRLRHDPPNMSPAGRALAINAAALATHDRDFPGARGV